MSILRYLFKMKRLVSLYALVLCTYPLLFSAPTIPPTVQPSTAKAPLFTITKKRVVAGALISLATCIFIDQLIKYFNEPVKKWESELEKAQAALLKQQKIQEELLKKREELRKKLEPSQPKATKDNERYTFANIAGTIPEPIHRLRDQLSNSEKYTNIGARMPKGILLEGPPGTGKTSIARALAGETKGAFFAISASQFQEAGTVGAGPRTIELLFNKARDALNRGYPIAFIFIDELDCIARRTGKSDAGNRETLAALLDQMDGFNKDSSIIVIGATNRSCDIDKALLRRGGRFDQIVTIGLPNQESREAILRYYLNSVKHEPDIEVSSIAEITNELSGADLEAIVNNAAIAAVSEDSPFVLQAHLCDATIEYLSSKLHQEPTSGRFQSVPPHERLATFDDIAGAIPEEILEIRDLIRNSETYTERGAKMPKGILLVGPPGTGKRSVAHAIASETNASFFQISGSAFIDQWTGTGPKAVRELFQEAQNSVKTSSCNRAIIFIDKIDSIGGKRITDGASQAYLSTRNELLTQMNNNPSVIVIATTNNIENVDQELRNGNRFGYVITMNLPDKDSRAAILRHLAKAIKHEACDFEELADLTEGLSGADLKTIMNKAAILSVKMKDSHVAQDHIIQAIEKYKRKNK